MYWQRTDRVNDSKIFWMYCICMYDARCYGCNDLPYFWLNDCYMVGLWPIDGSIRNYRPIVIRLWLLSVIFYILNNHWSLYLLSYSSQTKKKQKKKRKITIFVELLRNCLFSFCSFQSSCVARSDAISHTALLQFTHNLATSIECIQFR